MRQTFLKETAQVNSNPAFETFSLTIILLSPPPKFRFLKFTVHGYHAYYKLAFRTPQWEHFSMPGWTQQKHQSWTLSGVNRILMLKT